MKGFLNAIELGEEETNIDEDLEEPEDDNAIFFHGLCCLEKILEF